MNMDTCTQTTRLYFRRTRRGRTRYAHYAKMRAAKERKRLENDTEREPRMERTTCLSWAVRDDLTGHVEWLPLKSVRDVVRRVAVLLRHYQPGLSV